MDLLEYYLSDLIPFLVVYGIFFVVILLSGSGKEAWLLNSGLLILTILCWLAISLWDKEEYYLILVFQPVYTLVWVLGVKDAKEKGRLKWNAIFYLVLLLLFMMIIEGSRANRTWLTRTGGEGIVGGVFTAFVLGITHLRMLILAPYRKFKLQDEAREERNQRAKKDREEF